MNAAQVLILGLNFAPEVSGIAPYTNRTAEGLAERGHKVRVLTTRPHYPDWNLRPGWDWRRVAYDGRLDVRRLRHYVPSHPNLLRRMASEVSFGLRLLAARWGRPDVVICVTPALFSTALAALRLRVVCRRAGSIAVVQDLYSLGVREAGGLGPLFVSLMSVVEGLVLRNFDRVVVIHERFRWHVVNELGVDPQRVVVVRNWTHTPSRDEGIDLDEVRQQLGWGARGDEAVVLHAGAMGLKQDLGNVVAAARLADDGALPIRFVLVGGGSQRPLLEKSAAGVKRIQFSQHLDERTYAAALAAADVLLVNEGAEVRDMAVPSKLTAYFQAGRPTLAATDGASTTAAEIASSGAGIRVEPADPRALVDGALCLARDSEQAAALGRAGQLYCRDVLSESRALDAYAHLVAEFLSDHGGSV